MTTPPFDPERFYRSSPIPVLTVDIEARRILDCNDATLEVLGRSRADVIGRPGADFLEEPASDELLRVRSLAGESTRVVRRIRTAQGLRTAELHLVPTDVEGVVHIQAVDLTDVLDANRRLDGQAAELQRKTQALSSLTARVAHDVKGPLATVMGFARIVERSLATLPPERITEMLGRIAAVASSLAAMVDGMLLDALDVTPEDSESTDPTVLARTVSSVYEADLESTRASLDVVTDGVDELPVPASVLRQPLINLIGNSLKFRRADDPLHITLRFAADEGDFVVEVTDDGRGFDGDPEALFARGARGANASGEAGSGLGLAFTRAAIEDLGGDIEAFVPDGGGAGFRIRLPELAPADNPAVLSGTAASGVMIDRIEALFDASPVPHVIIDLAARQVVRVNASMVRLVGRSADQIIGRPAADLLVDRDQGAEARQALIASAQRPVAFHGAIRHADGTEVPIMAIVAADPVSSFAIAQTIPTDDNHDVWGWLPSAP